MSNFVSEQPKPCPIVDAGLLVYRGFKDQLTDLPADVEIPVGSFLLSRNSARMSFNCGACASDGTLQVVFEDPELGPHMHGTLPEGCPHKPDEQDAPVLFIAEDVEQ